MTGFASLEPVDATPCGINSTPDHLFGLGTKYSTDCLGRFDLVMAHMYFNLAAMKGHRHAMERRAEVAAELSAAEIAVAQRAARIWSSKR